MRPTLCTCAALRSNSCSCSCADGSNTRVVLKDSTAANPGAKSHKVIGQMINSEPLRAAWTRVKDSRVLCMSSWPWAAHARDVLGLLERALFRVELRLPWPRGRSTVIKGASCHHLDAARGDGSATAAALPCMTYDSGSGYILWVYMGSAAGYIFQYIFQQYYYSHTCVAPACG